jgi:hypothetical protein
MVAKPGKRQGQKTGVNAALHLGFVLIHRNKLPRLTPTEV